MRALSLVPLLAVLLAGCSCGDDDEGGTRTSTLVGPGGGRLASADGRLEVRVPAGALDHDVTLFIDDDPAGIDGPPGIVGVPYRVGPEGTAFAEPVTLTFSYDAGALGEQARALRVTTSAAGLVWSCIPMSGTDEDAGIVVASVMHLSVWALRLRACGRDADCEAPERCLEGGVCAIPCAGDGDCASGDSDVLSCVGGACNHGTCADGAGCRAGTTCSAEEGPGVCLPACEAGSRCGAPTDQQICTAAGHCVFDTECSADPDQEAPGILDCARVSGFEDRPCLHGWCIPDIAGCDCASPDCPCLEEGGGDGDADADADADADGDGDGDGDGDADALREPRSYCALPCVEADECCGGAGCAESLPEIWECRTGHCVCIGCRDDGDCAVDQQCFQQAAATPRGEDYTFDCLGLCATPCPNGDECDLGQECRTDPVAQARGLLRGGEPYCRDPSFSCSEGDSCGFTLDCDPASGGCTCSDDPTACQFGTECIHWPCGAVTPGAGAAGDACVDDRDCDAGRCCLTPEDCPLCTCS